MAVKFLLSISNRKINRFKSEYFNTNYVRDELNNIVNLIYYGEVMVKEDILVPYIIMPQYIENLKKYRKEKNEIKEEDFVYLVKFLFSTLNSIHKKELYIGILNQKIF